MGLGDGLVLTCWRKKEKKSSMKKSFNSLTEKGKREQSAE